MKTTLCLLLFGMFHLNLAATEPCPAHGEIFQQTLAKTNIIFSGKSLLGEDGTEEHYEALQVSGCEVSLELVGYHASGTEFRMKHLIEDVDDRARWQTFLNGQSIGYYWADLRPVSGNLMLTPDPATKGPFVSRECVLREGRTKCRHKWMDEKGEAHAIILQEF